MAAAKLAEANSRASSRADAEAQCQAELADLRRSSEDSLQRARSTAALQVEQAQTIAQQQIAAMEVQAATKVQIAELKAVAARADASELAESRIQDTIADSHKQIEMIMASEQSLEMRVNRLMEQERKSEHLHAVAIENMRAQAAAACSRTEHQAAAEVARVRSELAEALDALDQRDADHKLVRENAEQAECAAQSRVADIEEEVVNWKQSAGASFAETLAAYRVKMEAKLVEMERELVLAREEAQQHSAVARRAGQALEHAERRAARKVCHHAYVTTQTQGDIAGWIVLISRVPCAQHSCSLAKPTLKCIVYGSHCDWVAAKSWVLKTAKIW